MINARMIFLVGSLSLTHQGSGQVKNTQMQEAHGEVKISVASMFVALYNYMVTCCINLLRVCSVSIHETCHVFDSVVHVEFCEQESHVHTCVHNVCHVHTHVHNVCHVHTHVHNVCHVHTHVHNVCHVHTHSPNVNHICKGQANTVCCHHLIHTVL